MCLDTQMILNSQLPLVGLKIAEDLQFIVLLNKYSKDKSEKNYKLLEKRLQKLRIESFAKLKIISEDIEPFFHMYVLDSDFNVIANTNDHPSMNRAVSVTYQMANNERDYKTVGTLSAYAHNFMPSVNIRDVKENKDIIIDTLIIGTYAANANYEGSYKSLYFGCGIAELKSAVPIGSPGSQ